jgi:hypothetical protein
MGSRVDDDFCLVSSGEPGIASLSVNVKVVATFKGVGCGAVEEAEAEEEEEDTLAGVSSSAAAAAATAVSTVVSASFGVASVFSAVSSLVMDVDFMSATVTRLRTRVTCSSALGDRSSKRRAREPRLRLIGGSSSSSGVGDTSAL